MVGIELDNASKKVLFDFGRLDKQFRKGVRRGLIRNVREVAIRVKLAIRAPGRTGIKYKSLPRRSSAPNETPAKQSGNLLNSVKGKVGGLRGLVGYTINYGRFLELGVRGRMAPRTGLQNVIASNESIQRQKHNCEQELNKYLGR